MNRSTTLLRSLLVILSAALLVSSLAPLTAAVQDDDPEVTARNAVTMFEANTQFRRGNYLEAARLYASVETGDPGTAFEAELGEMLSLAGEAARLKEKEKFEEALQIFDEAAHMLEGVRGMDISFLPDKGSNFIFSSFFIRFYLGKLGEHLKLQITDCLQGAAVLAEDDLDKRTDLFKESIEPASVAQKDNAVTQITACGELEANETAAEKDFKKAAKQFSNLSRDANPVQKKSADIRADRLKQYHKVADKLKDLQKDFEILSTEAWQEAGLNEDMAHRLQKYFKIQVETFIKKSGGKIHETQ